MCYSVPPPPLKQLAGRWPVVVIRPAQGLMAAAAPGGPAASASESTTGSSSSSSMNRVRYYCACSPTKHPGSFRCRHHQALYVWRRRSTAAHKRPAPN